MKPLSSILSRTRLGPRLERKRQQREEYKNLIIQAAEAVIQRRGLSETTMDDVAKEVQFSKATIYRYFPNKASLVNEIVIHYFEEVRLALDKIRGQEKSASDKLREWLLFLCRFQTEKTQISRLLIMDRSYFKLIRMFMTDSARNGPDTGRSFMQAIMARRRQIRDGMADLLRQGVAAAEFRSVDITSAVEFLGSITQGYFHSRFVDKAKRNLGQDVDRMYDFIMKGIGKEP
jgi:AcrR family transcriptional regulator